VGDREGRFTTRLRKAWRSTVEMSTLSMRMRPDSGTTVREVSKGRCWEYDTSGLLTRGE